MFSAGQPPQAAALWPLHAPSSLAPALPLLSAACPLPMRRQIWIKDGTRGVQGWTERGHCGSLLPSFRFWNCSWHSSLTWMPVDCVDPLAAFEPAAIEELLFNQRLTMMELLSTRFGGSESRGQTRAVRWAAAAAVGRCPGPMVHSGGRPSAPESGWPTASVLSGFAAISGGKCTLGITTRRDYWHGPEAGRFLLRGSSFARLSVHLHLTLRSAAHLYAFTLICATVFLSSFPNER